MVFSSVCGRFLGGFREKVFVFIRLYFCRFVEGIVYVFVIIGGSVIFGYFWFFVMLNGDNMFSF